MPRHPAPTNEDILAAAEAKVAELEKTLNTLKAELELYEFAVASTSTTSHSSTKIESTPTLEQILDTLGDENGIDEKRRRMIFTKRGRSCVQPWNQTIRNLEWALREMGIKSPIKIDVRPDLPGKNPLAGRYFFKNKKIVLSDNSLNPHVHPLAHELFHYLEFNANIGFFRWMTRYCGSWFRNTKLNVMIKELMDLRGCSREQLMETISGGGLTNADFKLKPDQCKKLIEWEFHADFFALNMIPESVIEGVRPGVWDESEENPK